MRHEQWAHRQRIWRCPDHPQHEFSKRSEYEDHVNMQHANSKHLLLSSELLTAQESVSCLLDRPCPFCLQDYEDVFEMQQHVASHLEAVALLSVPNLDEDKKSAKGNSNSANSNHAESKAGGFDSTEVLLFPENEGPGHLRSSSEAEKRAFRTKLEILNQSCGKASGESVIAESRSLVRDWLDDVRSGTRISPKVKLKNDVLDNYKQLAQVLRQITLEDDRNEHLLHLSRAVLAFLLDLHVRASLPEPIEHVLSNIEQFMQWLDQVPSDGPVSFQFVYSGTSFMRRPRMSFDPSYEEPTDVILRLVDNMIMLLESIRGPLIEGGVSHFSSAP